MSRKSARQNQAMPEHEQADDTTASTASTSSATSVPAEPMSTQEMMRMMTQVFREQMVSTMQEVVKDAMRKETLRAEGTMAAAGASSSTSAPGELVTEQSVMLLFAQFQEAVFKRMDEHGKRGAHDETPELAETSHAVSTTAVATTSSPDVTITSTTPASAAICTNLRRHGSKVKRFSGSREDAKDIRRKTISDHNRDSLASTDSSAMLSYESMTEKQRELYDKAKNASETLHLCRKQIGDAEAQAIAEALKDKPLVVLRLGSNRIGDGGAWAIAEALKVNTTLTWFYLDSNQIGDAGAQAIAEALKDKPLAELKLGGNRIGDAGARAIAEALKVNKTLTQLELGSNRIGDGGAWAIAEALKVNKTLTQLEFGDNPIGDVGAQAVAEALTVNKTLTRLSLWSSQIGDAGARAIAEALKVNKTLTQLDLGDNQIGDVGAQAVAEALKVNKTLTRLSLSCNRIGDAGAVAIAEALTVNKTLTELYLTYNCISVLGSEAIYRACTGKRRLQAFHGSQVNPLAFSFLPRLASAEDIQEVLGVLTSGLELENQRISLPALPTEIAELIMDKAHCWQGMQNTKREYFHIEDRRVPKVTVPQGNSIRVKAIQVLRDWRSRPDNTDDCAFDLTVRDEQGAVRYECAVHPTFVDSNLTHATICRASHPIVRQMREGWQVQIRASEFGRDVTFESLYVGFGLHE